MTKSTPLTVENFMELIWPRIAAEIQSVRKDLGAEIRDVRGNLEITKDELKTEFDEKLAAYRSEVITFKEEVIGEIKRSREESILFSTASI